MDPAIVLAILGGIVSVVTALVAFLQRGWRQATERESKAKDDLVVFVKGELLSAQTDKRHLEQRLQFFIETVKAQQDVADRAVALNEKIFERLQQEPTTKSRATHA